MAGKIYYVYILGSLSGTLYIGITNDLHRRVFEHKQGKVDGFTKQYGVDCLLYWESYDDVLKAIAKERQLKGWRPEKKVALFERVNPSWKDLAKDWYDGRGPSTRLLVQNRDEQPRSG